MEVKGDGVRSLAKIPSPPDQRDSVRLPRGGKAHKNAKMTKTGRNEEPRYLPILRRSRGDPGATRVGH